MLRNTYNVYLPLDTLALNGALLEWGHTSEAQKYLGYFFATKINTTSGSIIYGPFGCDADADYGRLIATFVRAVEYGGDVQWAAKYVPTIHAMARAILARRTAAEAAFPRGHPLHGITAGSPEHDICRGPGYFFSVNAWHVRGILELGRLHASYPDLSINATLEASLVSTATAWRADLNRAANFTAVREAHSGDVYFLHPVVGSAYGADAGSAKGPLLQAGGTEVGCVARGTCFASMTAGLPDGSSNQHTNYANFRIFSETLLAGVLEAEYEIGIMQFRESHRGTLLGMTRFRDGLDDMPILGYGRGALAHGRRISFHAVLAGHTLQYLSRGTHWGTEQRQQLSRSTSSQAQRMYRNNCGISGEVRHTTVEPLNWVQYEARSSHTFVAGIRNMETLQDCSLCMVSSIASAYWVRWMLVTADRDASVVYVGQGAPRRWFTASDKPGRPAGFAVDNAPTRLGLVSFKIELQSAPGGLSGWVAVEPNHRRGHVTATTVAVAIRHAVKRSLSPFEIRVLSGDAKVVGWFPGNETALFRLGADHNFSFAAAPGPVLAT